MIVAIDGPAGAGKSTIARSLAERLGFLLLDTGAMYRALTWLALERGVPLGDGEALTGLAHGYPVELEESGRAWIDGTEVTDAIREPRIDRVVSIVAAHPSVRAVMRDRQQDLASRGDSVIEGRDIGTVVAPEAEVKVYLVAEAGVRARRRQAERPGIGVDALATDLELRDASDAARMHPAADARLIDTTELGVDEVVRRVEAIVRELLPA